MVPAPSRYLMWSCNASHLVGVGEEYGGSLAGLPDVVGTRTRVQTQSSHFKSFSEKTLAKARAPQPLANKKSFCH